jgi:SAM-dependent methyltransferase
MEFTGERVVPGKVEPDLFNEHLSRYYFASRFASSRRVLDLGCGSGYGSAVLAEFARYVIASDISSEAISYARQSYPHPTIHYLIANCSRLPISTGSLDLVICFEVVEHLHEQHELLEETARVLKPEGLLLISTPNRLYYTEERKELNPYHTREFSFDEFSSFLRQQYQEVEITFQNHVSSIFVGDPDILKATDARIENRDPDQKSTANFFLAVCSKTTGCLPKFGNLILLPSTANLLREKEHWIGALESRVKDLDKNILRLQKEYDDQTEWCLKLDQQVEERVAELIKARERADSLEKELMDRTDWANRLSQELNQRDERIVQLQKEFDERTQWALQLDGDLAICQAKLEGLKQSKLYRFSKALGIVPKL